MFESVQNYRMEPEAEGTRGEKSAHYLATGPVMALPLSSPLGLTMTPALSSKLMKMPFFLLQALRWRTTTAGVTFLRSSGLPFFTVAITMSPTPAAGRRFKRPETPNTDRMYRLW